MKTVILIISMLMFVFLSSVSYAGEESGGYAGSFLEWGAGARAIALGKTFTAIANDGTALYWNPAGLSQIATRELTAMHSGEFPGSDLGESGRIPIQGSPVVGDGGKGFSQGNGPGPGPPFQETAGITTTFFTGITDRG